MVCFPYWILGKSQSCPQSNLSKKAGSPDSQNSKFALYFIGFGAVHTKLNVLYMQVTELGFHEDIYIPILLKIQFLTITHEQKQMTKLEENTFKQSVETQTGSSIGGLA